jgi:hypothetical protein
MFVPDLRCLPRRQSIPPAHPVRAGRPRPQDGSAPAHPVQAERSHSQDGSAPAHPVRAGRSHSQDGTRCTAACGWDARAPRVAPSTSRGRDARALRRRVPLCCCLRAGRPRTQGRDARAPRAEAYLRTRCGRDARAPRRCVPLCCCLRAGRPRAQDGSAPAHPVRAGRPRTQGGSVPAHPVRAGRPRTQAGVPPAHSDGACLCAAACGRDARAPRNASCRSGFCITLSHDQALQSLPPVRARARTAIPAHTHTTSSGGGATAPRFRFPRR